MAYSNIFTPSTLSLTSFAFSLRQIHNKELEKLREKFYILQAQVKLENDDTW